MLLLVKLVGGFGNLFSTGYGRLALLKAIVSAVVIYVALVNRTTAAARLGRLGLMPARLAFRLRRAIGTELTIGALVLVLTAWMVGSHPPGLDASAAQRSKPTLIVGPMTNSAGLDLEVGFAPALSGLNTVTITVDKPATGLVTLVVQFDPIDQYVESIVIEAPTTLTGRGELVVEDVPFNAPGRWKVTVTGTGTDGSLGTLESEFTLAPGTTVTTADQSTVPATPSTVTSVVDDAGG
ncbi:MAG: CopD family protein [Ilumatobacteraceae bacterium]